MKAAQKKSILQQMDAISGVTSSKAQNTFLVSFKEVEKLDLVDLVGYCIAEKKLVSFKVAREVALQTDIVKDKFNPEAFRQTDSGKLAAMFNVVTTGADACLVNLKGEHADKVVVEHEAWLADNGFDAVIEHRTAENNKVLERLQGRVKKVG